MTLLIEPEIIQAAEAKGTVGVLGTGSYVPAEIITNDVVGAPAGVTDEWITRKTGIRQRRFAGAHEATSDLAIAAGRRALESARLDPAAIGTIIVATSTADSPQPPTSCIVQDALGARNAAAFDLNAVCSGFIFALATGQRLAGGQRPAGPGGGNVLVIGADTYSRILDRDDRRTAILFGDGAGAVILGPVQAGHGIVASKLMSFGDRRDLIHVPGGGSRQPASERTLAEGLHYFRMDGRGVRDFVGEVVPGAVRQFLAEARVNPDDIAHVIPHQANGVMVGELAARVGLDHAAWHSTVERYGNTSAASVPVTLDEAARSGRVRPGDLVLLVGFGGGMAAGLSLVRWGGAPA